MLIGGAAISAVGCLVPWISPQVNVPNLVPVEVTRDLFSTASHAPLPGVDGWVITGLAVVSIVLGLLMWSRTVIYLVAVGALVLAVVAAVTVLADFLDVSGSINVLRTTYFQVYQVGVGLYITSLGVVVWTIGAAVGLLGALRT